MLRSVQARLADVNCLCGMNRSATNYTKYLDAKLATFALDEQTDEMWSSDLFTRHNSQLKTHEQEQWSVFYQTS